jgi:hypothetical protein
MFGKAFFLALRQIGTQKWALLTGVLLPLGVVLLVFSLLLTGGFDQLNNAYKRKVRLGMVATDTVQSIAQKIRLRADIDVHILPNTQQLKQSVQADSLDAALVVTPNAAQQYTLYYHPLNNRYRRVEQFLDEQNQLLVHKAIDSLRLPSNFLQPLTYKQSEVVSIFDLLPKYVALVLVSLVFIFVVLTCMHIGLGYTVKPLSITQNTAFLTESAVGSRVAASAMLRGKTVASVLCGFAVALLTYHGLRWVVASNTAITTPIQSYLLDLTRWSRVKWAIIAMIPFSLFTTNIFMLVGAYMGGSKGYHTVANITKLCIVVFLVLVFSGSFVLSWGKLPFPVFNTLLIGQHVVTEGSLPSGYFPAMVTLMILYGFGMMSVTAQRLVRHPA